MMMYESDNLTARELDLYWEVLVDAEDTIVELIEAKNSTVGAISYEGLTITYQIDSEGDASIETIMEDISMEGIEDAE